MISQGSPATGHYDYQVVALSVAIAVLASGAALDLAGRVTAARGRSKSVWLVGGALAMGLGIWSMHYTGMLALRLPMPTRYHVPTVALSLLAAVLASGVALRVASRERLTVAAAAGGSLLMGAGIVTMHYTGMAGMRLAAVMEWDLLLVGASIVIAVAASWVALWLAFRAGHADSDRWTSRKLGSALAMGAAIPVMHYTGMAAARFRVSNETVDMANTVDILALGPDAIAAGTLLVLVVAIASSVVDRLLSAQAAKLQAALAEVKTLRRLLPICATCKRVRTNEGSWQGIEVYLHEHTDAEVSHGMCPECAGRWEEASLAL